MFSTCRAAVTAFLLAGTAAFARGPMVPAPCDTALWTALLRAHLARYPAMQPADAYKLLHQATLGSEHAMPSRAMAEDWLTRELSTLPAGPAEPLLGAANSTQSLSRGLPDAPLSFGRPPGGRFPRPSTRWLGPGARR